MVTTAFMAFLHHLMAFTLVACVAYEFLAFRKVLTFEEARPALAEPGLPARLPDPPEPPAAEPVTPELRARLWRDCGLIRDAAGLERLQSAPHLLTRLIAESALTREESRGSHFRADFPTESEAFERHVVLRTGAEPALEPWS